ncbi:MAG: cell wall metabolism sensor histidine kinase WalK [Clostridiales bacterium]|jgi:two-component system sensor histidine kinase VicK|nr:cell wall metabolism sensor histidine kinase WalK [Clostridiales bacterium]
MKSIRWKVVALWLAVSGISLAASGTFMTFALNEGERDAAYRELKQYAAQIKNEVIEPNYPVEKQITLETFQDSLRINSRGSSTQIQGFILSYTSFTCKTVATTITDDELLFPEPRTKVVISAEVGESAFEYNRRLPDYTMNVLKPFHEYAEPYGESDDGTGLIIYVRKDATQSVDKIRQVTGIFAFSVVIAFGLTIILGAVFAGSITVPVSALTKRADKLAESGFSREVIKTFPEIKVRDEIGKLSDSFNEMAYALADTLSAIENEKSKLEILLNNMTDGVLAYDEQGSLIHANYMCEELLDVRGEKFFPLDKVFSVLNITYDGNFTDVFSEIDIEKSRTITIGEKYINASFNLYRRKNKDIEGLVIVLSDVTRQVRLDNMRREFVANVSHELRTPLTTIKGYAETIIDGAIDERETALSFLHVIDSEADRMTAIISDLLDLSRFDNSRYDLKLSNVDLTELIKSVAAQNEIIAKKLSKEIIFIKSNKPAFVKIDKARVKQVINNIISNSLKYSDKGAYVKIYMEENDDSFLVYAEDNGFGISEEDASRIFERFFRVDKARSRKLGGTGLGLSIAKEIMEIHGGNIFCDSKLDKGTTMILRFPKDFDGIVS